MESDAAERALADDRPRFLQQHEMLELIPRRAMKKIKISSSGGTCGRRVCDIDECVTGDAGGK